MKESEKPEPQEAENYARPREFVFGMGGHMRWTINGGTFQMTEVSDWEQVNLKPQHCGGVGVY